MSGRCNYIYANIHTQKIWVWVLSLSVYPNPIPKLTIVFDTNDTHTQYTKNLGISSVYEYGHGYDTQKKIVLCIGYGYDSRKKMCIEHWYDPHTQYT